MEGDIPKKKAHEVIVGCVVMLVLKAFAVSDGWL